MKAFLVKKECKKVYSALNLTFGSGLDVFKASLLLAVEDGLCNRNERIVSVKVLQRLLFVAIQETAELDEEEINLVAHSIMGNIQDVRIFDVIQDIRDRGEFIVYADNPRNALAIVDRDTTD